MPRLEIHPGTVGDVRIHCLPGTRHGFSRVVVAPGDDLIATVETWVATGRHRGAAFRLLAGSASILRLMTGKPSDAAGQVATFHGPHEIACPAAVLGGHGAVGRATDGTTLLTHCHAVFMDRHASLRGCHLVKDGCIAGEDGITLAAVPLPGSHLRAGPDLETGFTLFFPEAAR
jgi:predicted DNA-binding protein with PD1-like motif